MSSPERSQELHRGSSTASTQKNVENEQSGARQRRDKPSRSMLQSSQSSDCTQVPQHYSPTSSAQSEPTPPNTSDRGSRYTILETTIKTYSPTRHEDTRPRQSSNKLLEPSPFSSPISDYAPHVPAQRYQTSDFTSAMQGDSDGRSLQKSRAETRLIPRNESPNLISKRSLSPKRITTTPQGTGTIHRSVLVTNENNDKGGAPKHLSQKNAVIERLRHQVAAMKASSDAVGPQRFFSKAPRADTRTESDIRNVKESAHDREKAYRLMIADMKQQEEIAQSGRWTTPNPLRSTPWNVRSNNWSSPLSGCRSPSDPRVSLFRSVDNDDGDGFLAMGLSSNAKAAAPTIELLSRELQSAAELVSELRRRSHKYWAEARSERNDKNASRAHHERNIYDLKSLVDDLSTELEELQHIVKERSHRVNIVTEELQQSKAETQTALSLCETFKTEKEDTDRYIEELEAERMRMMEENETIRDKLAGLEKSYSVRETKMNETAMIRVHGLEQEIMQLTKELERCRDNTDMRVKVEKAQRDVEQAMQEADRSVQEKSIEISKLLERLSILEDDLSLARQQLNEAELREKQLEDQNTDKQRKIREQLREISELWEQMTLERQNNEVAIGAVIKQTNEAHAADLAKENEALRRKLEKCLKEKTAALEKHAALVGELVFEKSVNSPRMEHVTSISERYETEKNNILRDHQASLGLLKETHERELKLLREQIDALTGEKEKNSVLVNRSLEQQDEAKKVIASYRREIDELQHELKLTREKVNDREAAENARLEELRSMERQYADLKRQIDRDELVRQPSELQKMLQQQSQDRIKELETALRQAHVDLENEKKTSQMIAQSMEQSVAKAADIKELMEEKVIKERQKRRELENDISSQRNKIVDLNQTNMELKEELLNVTRRNEFMSTTESKELTKLNEMLRLQNDALIVENTALKKLLEEARQNLSEAQFKLEKKQLSGVRHLDKAKEENLRARLVEFYTQHAPNQLSEGRIDALVNHVAQNGQEDALFAMLRKKYLGQQPTEKEQKIIDGMGSVYLSPVKKYPSADSYLHRVLRIYEKYAPTKRSRAAVLLNGDYRGREEQLISDLVKKYGPEPEPW